MVGKRYEALVLVTPRPVFSRVERRHDRVIFLVKMFRRVFVTRRIAAPDVAAFKANAQMHPLVVVLNTLLAAVSRAWSEDCRQVGVIAGVDGGKVFMVSADSTVAPFKPNSRHKDRKKMR